MALLLSNLRDLLNMNTKGCMYLFPNDLIYNTPGYQCFLGDEVPGETESSDFGIENLIKPQGQSSKFVFLLYLM